MSIKGLVDHFEKQIRDLPEQPVLIGHSFGGLIVQMLLDRGLAAAGVAIDAAPPREALEILGLDPGAEVWHISEAHRRLLQTLHPDRSDSACLAIKVTQVRDVLLRAGTGQLRRLTTDLPRQSSR